MPFYRLVFIGIISYLEVLDVRKKKLTDIGFYFGFDGLDSSFNGFGFLINVC
jgi:hypothetical protein